MKALLAFALIAAAPAPRLFADLSQPRVDISYGYDGAELRVYGAVQYPRDRIPDQEPRIAVVARGPDKDLTVREKARRMGIWINAASVRFRTVPAYVAVATTRPVDELLDRATAALWEIGLDSLAFSPESDADPAEADRFARGLRDLRTRAGLYRQDPRGVTVTENILYRARLVIPPAAPVGRYSVAVHLIEDGRVVATVTRALEVRKTGFEAGVSRFAESHAFAYGLAAVLLALATGWASSLIGRR
jgi:uncharacterized protein (TIGR02186 family)